MKYLLLLILLFTNCARYKYVGIYTLFRVYREGKERGCMIKAQETKKPDVYKLKMDRCYRRTLYAEQEKEKNSEKGTTK